MFKSIREPVPNTQRKRLRIPPFNQIMDGNSFFFLNHSEEYILARVMLIYFQE